MNKVETLIKHNKIIQSLYVWIFSFIFKFLGIFIRPRKIILFQSMIGKNFGDSPRVIFENIIKDDFFKDYKLVWAFENPNIYPECKVKKIKLNSLNYFIYALKSKIWISNTGIERSLHFKHKSTIHINTDHGVAYKYIGNAQHNRHDYNFKSVDLFCACSEFDRNVKIRDYRSRPEATVACGMPVNDSFFSLGNSKRDEYRKKYNVAADKKVILYAPTWRDYPEQLESLNTPKLNIEKWRKELGNEYILFVRVHHLAANVMDIQFDDFVRDGYSGVPIEDIVFLSDILITDYSDIAFHFSILEKPICSFIYDYKEYLENRGLYVSPYELFEGNAFEKEDDVIEYIKSIDYKVECEKSKHMKEKYMTCGGHATEYCINYLKERLSNHGGK